MALTDLEAFDTLSVMTTEMDEIEVAHLIKKKGNLDLLCQDCGGRRFKVEGFIPIEAEILAGRHTIMANINYKKVIVNRVTKCAHCNSIEFVAISNPDQEKKDG